MSGEVCTSPHLPSKSGLATYPTNNAVGFSSSSSCESPENIDWYAYCVGFKGGFSFFLKEGCKTF